MHLHDKAECSLCDLQSSCEHGIMEVIPIATDRGKKLLASSGRNLGLEIVQVVLRVDARQYLFHMH
jgi:hypothetical protein